MYFFNLDSNTWENLEIQGELVGISWISLELFEAMCCYHKTTLPKTCLNHYEETLSDLCSTKDVTYLKIPDLIWTEIDTESHYQRALNQIHPRLMATKNYNL